MVAAVIRSCTYPEHKRPAICKAIHTLKPGRLPRVEHGNPVGDETRIVKYLVIKNNKYHGQLELFRLGTHLEKPLFNVQYSLLLSKYCIYYFGFKFTYTIIAYHHYICSTSHSWWGVFDTYIFVSMVFTKYSGFLHQYNCPPRYNWNVIVENGIKTKLSRFVFLFFLFCYPLHS